MDTSEERKKVRDCFGFSYAQTMSWYLPAADAGVRIAAFTCSSVDRNNKSYDFSIRVHLIIIDL